MFSIREGSQETRRAPLSIRCAIRSNHWWRAVIDRVLPQVDCGRFAIKRCVGDITLEVMADVFVDGHEVPRVQLMHRRRGAPAWEETEMTCARQRSLMAASTLHELGGYEYTVIAWPDSWLSWKHDFERRVDAADIEVALAVCRTDRAGGRACARRRREAPAAIATELASAAALKHSTIPCSVPSCSSRCDVHGARSGDAARPCAAGHRRSATRSFQRMVRIVPRSVRGDSTHGRLADVEAILPQIAELGTRACCICRRSIRSASRSAKERTTRRKPKPDDAAVRGRSAVPKAATSRFIPSWAP